VSPVHLRRAFALADVLMALGGLAVMASVAYPPLEQRAYERRVERVVSGIEAVKDAATRYRDSNGHWPGDGGPREVPAELGPLLPSDLQLGTGEYELRWRVWKVVEIPPQPVPPPVDSSAPPPSMPDAAPPPAADSVGTRPPVVGEMGGIEVRSSEEGLLAALLDRFGTARSFVRDSTWTLVLGPDSPR
jgi:hypothetical protein